MEETVVTSQLPILSLRRLQGTWPPQSMAYDAFLPNKFTGKEISG